jgi:3-dehydroquinate dehydratase-1
VRTTTKKLDWQRANVVGTLHELRGWKMARRAISGVDAVEVRVDCLPGPPAMEDVQKLVAPAIVTVRDPAEGGARALSFSEREALYFELLPAAAAVDVEARNLKAFGAVVEAAHAAGVPVIASSHDFEKTPSRAALRRTAAQARDLGASCVKFAATPHSAGDLAVLLSLFDEEKGPLSVMGMGVFGRISRLLFAKCGSCLNYGWLGCPQVPGQWPALDFRSALDSL